MKVCALVLYILKSHSKMYFKTQSTRLLYQVIFYILELSRYRLFSGRILTCHTGGLGSFSGLGSHSVPCLGAFLVAQIVKNLPAMQQTWVWSLGQEDPLEKGMATHSSIFAWRIPWTEEPGGLQSTGSQRVRHDRVTITFSFIFGIWAKRIFWWSRDEKQDRIIEDL